MTTTTTPTNMFAAGATSARSQGNTAVYLLYAHARIAGIGRKSGKDAAALATSDVLSLSHPKEVDLALHICKVRKRERRGALGFRRGGGNRARALTPRNLWHLLSRGGDCVDGWEGVLLACMQQLPHDCWCAL
eukprot:365760-Chlamydomonas_euryale.AAC.7